MSQKKGQDANGGVGTGDLGFGGGGQNGVFWGSWGIAHDSGDRSKTS